MVQVSSQIPLAELEHSYSGSRNLFRNAAVVFGVDLTPQEDIDWRDLMEGAALVDHLLDIEKIDIVEPMRAIGGGQFRSELRAKSQGHFADYVQRQPVAKLDSMFEQLRRVNDLVVAQRKATRARDIVDIRIEEADILAAFLALPVGDTADAVNRFTFNRWLNSWSRTGYLVDSVMDLRSDYQNGESGVKPTVAAHFMIGTAACKEGVTALKQTPPKLIGKCAMNATKYVLLNVKPNIVAQAQ